MIYVLIFLAVMGVMAGLYASKQGETPQSSVLFGLLYAVGLACVGFVLIFAWVFLAVQFGWFS